MTLPNITIEGRAVADPELRFASSGTAVCNVRLVASSRKKEGDEWVDDKAFWINVKFFNKMAENVAETVTKGMEIVVSGRIHTEEWEVDGNKRSAPVVLADAVGPSLKWDAARIIKAERTTASSGSTSTSSAPASGSAPDEPPF